MIGKCKLKQAVVISILMIYLSAGFSVGVFASDSEVVIEASDDTIEIGTSTNIVVTLINMKGAEIQGIQGIENFDVMNTSQSSSLKSINGNTTREVKVSINVMPKEVGEFTIIAHVKYNGDTYQSNALKINVAKRDESLQNVNEDLFIKTNLSKESVYFGEKLVVSYELYSRYNIVNYGFNDVVNYDGFIANEVEKDDLSANIITLNGVKYAKYEVAKTILTPTQTGKLVIPAYKFQVELGSGSLFENTQSVYLTTEEMAVEVDQLPTTGRPVDFSGLVGAFELDSNYSSTEVAYGESTTLTVQLAGNVNLDSMSEMTNIPEKSFNVYQTEKNNVETVRNDQYYAEKEFEIILVPKETGEITIKPIKINYFDVESGLYKEAVIEGNVIQVTGMTDSSDAVSDESERNNINSKGTVQSIVISQISSTDKGEDYFIVRKRFVYIGIMIVSAIVVLVFLGMIFVRKQSRDDKALAEIYSKSKGCQTQQEVFDVLNDMVKYQYHFSIKAFSQGIIIEKINDRLVADNVLKIMAFSESNGKDLSVDKMKKMLFETYQLMKEKG